MKTKELMTKNVVTIDHKESALEAVRLMMKHKIRHLPVIKDNDVMGILSVDQLQSLCGSFDKVTVGRICDKFVVYASPESDIEEISHAFTSVKVQALPVLDKKGSVVGIITAMDFIKFLPNIINFVRAKDVIPCYA